MRKAMLIALLIELALAAGYSFNTKISCLAMKLPGNCVQWSHAGYMTYDSSCFPGHIRVMTPQGFKTIGELKKGDFALSLRQGKEEFSQIKGWLHREPSVPTPYLRVNSGQNTLLVSHKHNIVFRDDFVFAEDANWTEIMARNGSIRKDQVWEMGKYALWTANHNYFVYFSGSDDLRILAHDFANIRNPSRYETAVDVILGTWSIFAEVDEDRAHPGVQWMQGMFRSFVE